MLYLFDLRAPCDSMTMVDIVGLKRHYKMTSGTVKALDGIDLKIAEGERILLLGPSGSGKTTILDLLLGLLQPQNGEVIFDKNVQLTFQISIDDFPEQHNKVRKIENLFESCIDTYFRLKNHKKNVFFVKMSIWGRLFKKTRFCCLK